MTRLSRPLQLARQQVAALTEYLNWWVSPTPTPSFLNYYAAHRRSYRQALEIRQCQWGELWPWESKLGLRELADVTHLKTPRLLQGPIPIDDVRFHSLPDEFVIKPDRGDSGAGVYVLKRRGAKYRDLLRKGRILSERDIKSELHDLDNRGLISGHAILAEQALVTDDGAEIVHDFKFYCFQGHIPLVMQIARGDSDRGYKYYDGEWRDLGKARWHRSANPELPIPSTPDALLDAAALVSLTLPLPFVRVDLYEWEGQVFLGEATPMPGPTQRFRRRLDVTLGMAWDGAVGRLQASS